MFDPSAQAPNNRRLWLLSLAAFALFSSASLEKFKNDLEPDMAHIPAGTFQMGSEEGSRDEKPVHSVRVKAFYMATTEVTVSQFARFVEETGYKTDAEKAGDSSWVFSNRQVSFVKGVNWKSDVEGNECPLDEYEHPVIHVSWNDAQAYCSWISRKTKKKFRLPTEAEWEYAAANGEEHTKYSWGDGPPLGRPTDPREDRAGGNVADESGKSKALEGRKFFDGYDDGYALDAPVAQFAPNKLGLFDMTGNVWEWCQDCYHDNYDGAPSDSRAWTAGECKYRVLRGGSWVNDPFDVRTAFRSRNDPTLRSGVIGFRLARDAGRE